ncbi:tannase/feruloyl esterase family alpha/beta hydrolase [Sphingobium sufflavum]|uniref:tannase/feruloyl esterase family alpha/beta hydrolase n=1 Tax=Sphingobium sufflavum TaxID=1129547 RepID=UPI001F35BD48|nr:tannase/feruloyl esterase family alpha/beta hydrolase [Sphingobium sufflavum]MCE7797148.1 tannase/feruloyl esterase family alpha/beta hydrolase [Sphingobium sufflavum]
MISHHKTAVLAIALLGGSALSPTLAQVSPSQAAAAPVVGEDACGQLASLHLDQVTITSARTQIARAPVEGATMPSMTGQPGGGAAISGLPGFCRVTGSIHPEAGSDIRLEVWLPTASEWSGRLMGVGNGGLAGSISYIDLASTVQAGMVGAATDTGHSGIPTDSGWAKGHPERVRDYGWRAMHLTTVAAKQLIRNFYGRDAAQAYFASCSNGGRMGLMEASRFPDDYDGILAGAPASKATSLIMAHIWLAQVQKASGAAIRPDQVKLLQQEVLAQCDGIDGRKDGLVDDPRLCRFDTAKIACGTNASAQCFSPPQIDALKKIHAGPVDATGRRIAYGFPATGAETGIPVPFFGWEGAIAKGRANVPIQSAFPDVMLNLPPQPIASDDDFDFNRDPARVTAALSAEVDPNPNLTRFFARGGKLVMWHGWADATIPPQYTLSFHEQVLKASGPKAKTQMRLFMMPGVQHCFGGPGAATFGQIGAPPKEDTAERNITTALIDWVEKERAPQTLVGRLGMAMPGRPATGPEKQRLLCAYPAKAVLNEGADPDKATSYRCEGAAKGR